jgi:hypothetical protein
MLEALWEAVHGGDPVPLASSLLGVPQRGEVPRLGLSAALLLFRGGRSGADIDAEDFLEALLLGSQLVRHFDTRMTLAYFICGPLLHDERIDP